MPKSGGDLCELFSGVASALDRPIDSRTGNAEEFGDLGCGVLAGPVDTERVLLQCLGGFRLFPAKTADRLGDLHSLAGSCPNQISLELRDHREHVEEQPAHRVGGVMYGTADA